MTGESTVVERWCAGFEPDGDELVNQDAAIPAGDYYVTLRYGERHNFILGPYTDYLDVLANKPRGRRLLDEHRDRFSTHDRSLIPWLAFGHARLPVGTPCQTMFGK